MRKVRIDGAASGPGALRTVWIGATRVQERFLAWEPGHRLAFTLTESNAPDLHSMAEDWVVTPDPADPAGKAILTTTIGVEAARLLSPFPGLVRVALKRSLDGAAGITTQFP
jgi:Polyketide cyclase / dehydrase and lipid transport